MKREEAIERLKQNKAAAEYYAGQSRITAKIENALKDSEAFDMAIEALSTDVTQTDLVQRSDVLEVISDAQDGSGSTYNILQPIFVKVNNLPSCHRCDECDEQFYQQLLEKGMIELPQEYVSVVRCKDCINYESDGGALMVCRIDDMVVDDTDYCSYGERREP